MCYSLHAMPYRRESWLLTHLVSGLLFSLVPNVLAALYLMVQLEAYWFLGLYWLLAVTLQFLFFFGIAALSAMLTGNRIAMLAVYGILNFVAILLYATVNVIYLPMLEGVVVNAQAFTRFSPVVELFNFDFFQFEREMRTAHGATQVFFLYQGLSTGWGYTAILAAAGLAAMGAAFWLYRKRHLECAGDFVAFPKLKGVFCVILTLCVTLVFALVGKLLEGLLLWVFAGLFIGFFGSLMLLERRVKVFRKRTFLGFAAMALAVGLSLCAMEFDWLGIEGWTPKVQQVKSVQISNSSQYDYENGYIGRLSATLEDPEDIARILEAHEDILSRMGEKGSKHRVTLVYKMKSGRTVIRSYMAPTSGLNYEIIRQYLYKAEAVLGFSDPHEAAKRVTYMYCSQGPVPSVLYEKLLEALQADFISGTVLMDQYSEHYFEYELTIDKSSVQNCVVYVTDKAEKTMTLLKSPQMLMGYGKWEELLPGIEYMSLDGTGISRGIPLEQWPTLLEALRKDIEAGTVEPAKWGGGEICLTYEHRLPSGEYAYREFYISEKAENLQAWLKENVYTPAG